MTDVALPLDEPAADSQEDVGQTPLSLVNTGALPATMSASEFLVRVAFGQGNDSHKAITLAAYAAGVRGYRIDHRDDVNGALARATRKKHSTLQQNLGALAVAGWFTRHGAFDDRGRPVGEYRTAVEVTGFDGDILAFIDAALAQLPALKTSAPADDPSR